MLSFVPLRHGFDQFGIDAIEINLVVLSDFLQAEWHRDKNMGYHASFLVFLKRIDATAFKTTKQRFQPDFHRQSAVRRY